MRDLLNVLVVGIVALAAIAVVVFVGDDAETVVPPPQAVAEQFARALAMGRYDMALPHVESTSGITLTAVRVAGEQLRAQWGRVDQIDGEPGTIAGTHATAGAHFTSERAGPVRLQFRFVRRAGLWKIVEWGEQN
jgi:hypothetical protein